MQRCVVKLKKAELVALMKYVRFEKFTIAIQEDKPEYEIFMNREDLETILDIVGIVEDGPDLNSARDTLSECVRSLVN